MLILKNASLFDGTGARLKSNASVKIEGPLITDVGNDFAYRVPQNARILDMKGLFLMPGLINAHEHLATKVRITQGSIEGILQEPIQVYALRAATNAYKLLLQGITTIRECGSRAHTNIHIRDAINSGITVGPRIITCGCPIAITGGHVYAYSREADGPYEIRKGVREQIKVGADFIKVHASAGAGDKAGNPVDPQFSLDELKVIVEEAGYTKRKVAAHAIGRQAIKNIVEAGVSTLEHGHFLDKGLAKQMVERGIYYIPTLSGYSVSKSGMSTANRPAWSIEKAKGIEQFHISAFRVAAEAGVRIAAGTDSYGDLIEELELMADLGFSRKEALIAATATAAEALGVGNIAGTVEPGKQADLIAVDGNPLNDLLDLKKIKFVVKSGHIIMKTMNS